MSRLPARMVGAALLLLSTSLFAGEISVSCTAPTENTDGSPLSLDTIELEYGTESGVYTDSVDIGSDCQHLITLPDGATYYFVARARDTDGLYSVYSNEATAFLPGELPGQIVNLQVTWQESQEPVTPGITGTAQVVSALPVSVTIPTGTNAVYVFWQYWPASTGLGLGSVTLSGNAPDEVYENSASSGNDASNGVAAFYSPSSGDLEISWDNNPSGGPIVQVVFMQGAGPWRDAQGQTSTTQLGAVSVNLTTEPGDFVVKFDGRDGSPPALSSGWQNDNTGTNGGQGGRTSNIVATGASQVASSESEFYSGVVAIVVPGS